MDIQWHKIQPFAYLQWRREQIIRYFMDERQERKRHEFLFWVREKQKIKKGYPDVYKILFERYFICHNPSDYNLIFPINNYRNKIILDIGSGPHDVFQNISVNTVNSLDPLNDKYSKLRKWWKMPVEKMQRFQGYAEKMPFPDKSFNIVSSLNNLDHCEDYKKALKEIHRVLRPKGYFFLEVDIFHDVEHTNKLCHPHNFHWKLIDEIENVGFKCLKHDKLQFIPRDNAVVNGRYVAAKYKIPYMYKDEPGILIASFQKV